MAHFDANCIITGFSFFKILRFYVFKMGANGGRHFEIYIKLKILKTEFTPQKHAY